MKNKRWYAAEDWLAVWIGAVVLAGCTVALYASLPDQRNQTPTAAQAAEKPMLLTSPLKKWLAKPGSWTGNPWEAFYQPGGKNKWPGVIGVWLVSLLLFGAAGQLLGIRLRDFTPAFCAVFLLALLAYLLASQMVIKQYNLEYALWALAVGMLISNTVGTPRFIQPALRTELYIKTGLVILGAEVLFSKLLTLGVPGMCVAWVVTPIVLISTFLFGQRVLKIRSPALNMVISADMSVCGVSAAIATAAACKARQEELSLAIGLSLSFTAVMMVLMPALIHMLGMGEVLGGAWMGGTIDATGAVAAAGATLGDTVLEVAATVKMIQNILIGVTAFGVAVYWVLFVERGSAESRPGAIEIWTRFPKFVLGFVVASILFSLLYEQADRGPEIVSAILKGSTKTLRGWFFCLAFVCIGLDTNFRKLSQSVEGGKPLVLYLVGQSLNLILTLAMAWWMFGVVYKEQINQLLQGVP